MKDENWWLKKFENAYYGLWNEQKVARWFDFEN